eukprot:TRINITY_DN33271_c0_g1_i1.p1 TRINITY_DN33271_c0_g1~~TRINITY_DN33271_c0_g1_i1.p1  ORF type:complete len:206 (-),score=29.30 TRINITY_DN33271_c0_g1_i1:188-769(-)
MAHQCEVHPQALIELRSLFTHFDVRNQGSLSTVDLKGVLMRCGMGPLFAERVNHALDRNRDGQITWTEFRAAAIWVSVCRKERAFEAVFAAFDLDQDGSISADDLAGVLTDESSIEAWNRQLSALFEPLEKQDVSIAGTLSFTNRPSTKGIFNSLSKLFKSREAPKEAAYEQFLSFMTQKLDFRAGDALNAVN